MSNPPTISYFTPTSLPWRERPWNRWVKVAVIMTILSGGSVIVFLMSMEYWLIRPANVGIIGLASFLLLLAAFVVNTVALVSTSRRRTMQRGFVISLFSFILTFPSCGLFTMLCGPPAEVPQFRFDYATQECQWKIGRELQAYRDAHGTYPPQLAVLLAAGKVTPSDLIDPFSKTGPITLPPHLTSADWRKIAADVKKHSDLIYTAGDLPVDDAKADYEKIILLYDKPIPDRAGRLVRIGFEERFVPLSDLPALFAAHNAARAALGLPPQILDVQPPIPPLPSATTAR